MKTICAILMIMLAGCAAGQKTAGDGPEAGGTTRGVSAVIAEDPEKLRETVIDLIGDGPGAMPALETIARYEDDLRFVLGERSAAENMADSEATREAPLYDNSLAQRYVTETIKPLVTGDSRADRLRRFTRSSLAVAIIGINECYENFTETGDERFARKGLAHGYIALISDPSPTQKSRVIERMTALQEPLLKK
ncbi:MAG TPA: hypothetical protein VJO14_03440 [Bacteroidota bacterium]|nr:hypothetical protein [Bacteroidota bacterium]